MTAITGSVNMPPQQTIGGVHINDILDPHELANAQALGHVRQQVHPTEPLAILNYTEVCAYDGAWTPVTLACRGLIHRTDTGEVIARPFGKFFNYGQQGAPVLDLHSPAVVTDKADGSLGILYPVPSGGWAIATRGSFSSEQAQHATALWQSRYAATFRPRREYTYLFEIVYPANRIVVDYEGTDDLVYLGNVEIASGKTTSAAGFKPWGWDGPSVECMPYMTLAEALAASPRPNREGVVVHCLVTDQRVKLKQADYVALHRIVTGLNARVVWQHLLDGKPLADLIAPLPDEFHPWCQQIAAEIEAAIEAQVAEIEKAYAEVVAGLPAGFGRRDFAAVAVPHPLKWALFLLLDGRDPRPELWKRAKPEPYLTPSGRVFTEENA
jgi:RNA ligase